MDSLRGTGRTSRMIERAARYSSENDKPVIVICANKREVDRIMRQFMQEECWKYENPPQINFYSAASSSPHVFDGLHFASDQLFIDHYVYDNWNWDVSLFVSEANRQARMGTLRKKAKA